ncbi:cytochrome P450 [Nocardia alni]|uniref:cytochrome P450 n=1 Tax=Nocardia alni TaxID=2815723 RepID=UPI001C23DC28|nr:cytochrome P450 [Nocardia alni]
MPDRMPPAELSTAPRLPGAIPLAGHALRMRDPLGLLTTLPTHGDLVALHLGPARILMACTPELTHEILKNDVVFDKGGQFFERAREVVGNSLTTCTHDEHRRQRPLVQPAFHKSRMPGYSMRMSREIADICRSWRSGQVVDITAETNTLVTKILAVTVVSQELTPDELGRVVADVDTLVTLAAARMLLPPIVNRLPTPANRRYRAASGRLRDLMSAGVATNEGVGDDLLSILLATRSDRDALSNSEVIDQLMLFQIAGIDTAASALAWSLWLVATHPEVESALHAEVAAVLGPKDIAEHDHLPDLRYTGHVISETLRLYPPVWILTRTAMSDTRLGRYFVPAGTTVAISPYLLHRRPDLYPDPDRFVPERWDTALPEAGAFVPFGYAARRCIGEQFARAELTLALASIAKQWSLRPTPALARTRVTPRRAASLRPPRLPMILTRRQADSAADNP